jgi:hypothetical protein
VSALQSAVEWVERGFFPIPVPYRTKAPTIAGWQRLRIAKETAAQYFDGKPLNVGVLLGEPYGNADLDLDCAEAVAVAADLAPATGMVFGRLSKPRSHRFYRCDPPARSRKYQDPLDRKCILELRCRKTDGTTGLQTVVPPSVHESGEEIRFEPGFDLEPANIDSDLLTKIASKMAAAALLARHWPAEGHGRHDCELALAGVIARAGWTLEEAREFVLATYRAVKSHDHSKLERVARAVEDTFGKLVEGAAITGVPKLAELVDPKVVNAALRWMGISPKASKENQSRPDDLRDVNDLESVGGLEIYNAQYEPLRPVVANLLFNGITLCAGRPKVGKSWLVLSIAITVALGRAFWGRLVVTKPGKVLYCALEEPPSRTSNRLKKLLPSADPLLANVKFVYRLAPLMNGGAAELDAHLEKSPSDLVVVDTLSAIVRAGGRRDVFRSDYAEIAALGRIAQKHKTSILVVTHLRKTAAESIVDAVAGTSGLTAACDAIWGLRRQNDGSFLLEITGREMEDKTYGLRFDTEPATFGWNLIGEGSDMKMSAERKDILDLLREDGALEPKAVANLLGKNPNTTRVLLRKMAAAGDIIKAGKKYQAPADVSL